MKIKMIIAALMMVLTVPAMANKTRTGGAKELSRLETKAPVMEALKGVNDVLKQKSMPEISVKDVMMDAKDTALFLDSLKNLKKDIEDPTKIAKVEEIKKEGMVDYVNQVLQSRSKFEEAAKNETLPEAQQLPELSANIINVLRSSLETNTSSGLIGLSLKSIARFSEGRVTEASIKQLIQELTGLGLRLEDIIKCR